MLLFDIPNWPTHLKWHLVWHALFTLSAAVAAGAVPEYLIILNDGSSSRPGMDWVNANRTWAQTAEELAEFPGVHLKHPCGMWVEGGAKMVLDQNRRLQEYAAEHPDDPDIAAKADMEEFARVWANRPAKQFLSIYVGGSWSLRPLPNEKPSEWAKRAYAELAWARAAHPNMIAFDNEGGENEHGVITGPQGGMTRLIKMLQADGFIVGIEPAPHLGVVRYYDLWCIYSDVMLGKVEAAGGWDEFRKGRPNALRDPHKSPRCFFELGGRGLSDAEKIAEIKRSRERGEVVLFFYGQLTEEIREALQ